MKEHISKRNFIETAHAILEQEGLQGVSIRRIARDLDCNTANLYRYFKSRDELLLYASLQYLKDYLEEVKTFARLNMNSLELHYKVWECFSRHSFSHVELFNLLFFSKESKNLDRILRSYHQEFPENLLGMSKELQKVFLSGNFYYRDFLMLQRCVKDGFIRKEDAETLNQISIFLYKGFIKHILDTDADATARQKLNEQFNDSIKRIFSGFLIRS